MKTVDKIVEDNICAGCGLCYSVIGKDKLDFGFDESGYLRPKVKEMFTDAEDELFNLICPSVSAKFEVKSNYQTLWGPVNKIKTGYSTDELTRYRGASGGGLSGIATYLLRSKKVEGIIHIGASKENPILNEYKVSTTVEEIVENAGSRYSPSAPLVDIENILEKYNSLAFIGKPCDVVAMRNLMTVSDVAKDKVKYLLSFMCAGVPSIAGTKKIINDFGVKENDVTRLRYRGEGWPGYFTVEDKSGENYKMTYNDSWGKVLNRYLQLRCKVCADGTGETADITCADAWDTSENGYPSFEEKKGKSLIITRTNVGDELLRQAVSEGAIGIADEEISSGRVGDMQPYQKQRKQNIIARILPLMMWNRAVPQYNVIVLFKASLKENPLRLAKNFVGMMMRIKSKRV